MFHRTEPAYLGAYWGPRGEPASEIAKRLAEFLDDLAGLSPVASGWHQRTRSARSEGAVAETDIDGLTVALEAGANRRDTDGSPIPGLGYRWAAWNGRTDESMSVSLSGGIAARRAPLLNSVVVKFPACDSARVQALYDGAEHALVSAARRWDPDWAVLTSNRLRDAVGQPGNEPTVGWWTYLRGDGRAVSAERRKVANGVLLTAGSSWAELRDDDVFDVLRSLQEEGLIALGQPE